MDLSYSPADEAFRSRFQSFLREHLPAHLRDVPAVDETRLAGGIREWQGILHAHGWGAINWPATFGGAGATPVQQYIFELESALAGAPRQLPFGLKMLAPVLMKYGSDEQRARFLPGIITGRDWWCQGYSEPGAGSDLASLRTSAVRDGADYLVNGQKCWNTLGQHADWIFCLVRTDNAAKPQRGISLLLIDMHSPGITVRPTRLLDGTCEVNEIFFENVRVPAENRVGEENEGWTYAKYLLGYERANIAGVGDSRRALLRLKELALGQAGGAVGASLRRRIATIEIDLLALETTNLRLLSAAESGRAGAVEAAILKVRGSEIRQALSELTMEVIGGQALVFRRDASAGLSPAVTEGVTSAYLNLRKLSIFGGSNEIQKNIISQLTIGL